MTNINASALNHQELNEAIRQGGRECVINGCLGQRFIAAGMDNGRLIINGIPGNALGAYLNGADILISGNAQDAVGDTMNDGKIVVCGNIGGAAGYAMRGGAIYVKGNAGYRAGVHMKDYQEKEPVMVIGGRTGSFLGEYQAGGKIIVLGLGIGTARIVGNFPCTGMHGGKMYLRGDCKSIVFPSQVRAAAATEADMGEIDAYITEYCRLFGYEKSAVLDRPFTVVTPDSKNPYHMMYVAN